jgi:PhzF family phenazine biosynthesis protein
MKMLNYWHIDVFADKPFRGNPAAVFFDIDENQGELMQNIAKELNLSETVFLLKPTINHADYRVRIFTPNSEVPFAGHPTIAACFAYSKKNQLTQSKFVQECQAGLIPISIESKNELEIFTMQQKNPFYEDTLITRTQIAEMLGLCDTDLAATPAEKVSTGLPWLVVSLKSIEALGRIIPNIPLIIKYSEIYQVAGINVFALSHSTEVDVRVRTFAPKVGVFEDPTCGSGNGCVAAYIAKYDLISKSEYTAEQGIEMGRGGKVYLRYHKVNNSTSIFVGGAAVKVIEGTLFTNQEIPR